MPSSLISMYLVVALALFLLAARKSPAVSVVWLVGVVLVVVELAVLWAIGQSGTT